MQTNALAVIGRYRLLDNLDEEIEHLIAITSIYPPTNVVLLRSWEEKSQLNLVRRLIQLWRRSVDNEITDQEKIEQVDLHAYAEDVLRILRTCFGDNVKVITSQPLK